MMSEATYILEELTRAFEEFKRDNDERLSQIEKSGHADPLLEEKIRKLDERIDSLATAMRRTPAANDETFDQHSIVKSPSAAREYAKAYGDYLRKGEAAVSNLADLETKALSVGSDPDGGYTVTPQMSARIIEYATAETAMRRLATVETISSSSLEVIADPDSLGASWVGETEGRPDTATPQLRKVEIPAHELYSLVPATQKILDDSRLDLENWLSRRFGRDFGTAEGAAFITGDGVQKPRGILSYDAGTSFGQIERVNSGNASTLTADGLIDLFGSLKSSYRGNAVFLMNRGTEAAVRKLKDANGQYLWQPGLAQGVPATLLGLPVEIDDNMPDVAANALAVAVGDFREAYTIAERVGIRVLRDPYTSKPYVKFYATRRVGGAVVNFEALKLQIIAA